jgi:hypothetical protein
MVKKVSRSLAVEEEQFAPMIISTYTSAGTHISLGGSHKAGEKGKN